jgi:hypothetical protein
VRMAFSVSRCRSPRTLRILLRGLVIALSLIAIIYIGFVALAQEDMKKLVAYSSIAHMGFVTLGFFMFSAAGCRRRAGADDLARFRLRRDVLLDRRHVRPGAFAADCRLRRCGQHDAQVCRLLHAFCDGQRRPAGHFRLCRRVHGHPRGRRSTSGWPSPLPRR